jgi:hypothetical protein
LSHISGVFAVHTTTLIPTAWAELTFCGVTRL